jgi:hypothetical protein
LQVEVEQQVVEVERVASLLQQQSLLLAQPTQLLLAQVEPAQLIQRRVRLGQMEPTRRLLAILQSEVVVVENGDRALLTTLLGKAEVQVEVQEQIPPPGLVLLADLELQDKGTTGGLPRAFLVVQQEEVVARVQPAQMAPIPELLQEEMVAQELLL